VTEDVPHTYHPPKNIVKVQPLKKDEMQPLYAQDMGLEAVTHGFYGSMMQALGSCVGFCGAIPCCPFPNPFKEVRQGTSLSSLRNHTVLSSNVSFFLGSVGLVSRFGQFYKAVDPGLVQVNVCTEALRIVDVKIQIISIGRQTVITRDNVNVEM
jgi:erythrocyte band 7 integral membrane protein